MGAILQARMRDYIDVFHRAVGDESHPWPCSYRGRDYGRGKKSLEDMINHHEIREIIL